MLSNVFHVRDKRLSRICYDIKRAIVTHHAADHSRRPRASPSPLPSPNAPLQITTHLLNYTSSSLPFTNHPFHFKFPNTVTLKPPIDVLTKNLQHKGASPTCSTRSDQPFRPLVPLTYQSALTTSASTTPTPT